MTAQLWFGIVIGAVVASTAWWIHARSLKGVISDLKGAKNLVNK